MTSSGVTEVMPIMDVEDWTHCWNSTKDDFDPLHGYPYPSLYSWTHIVLSAFVVSAIMLLIVVGNSLVVVAITRDRRRLGGVQNYFIASLAVSDLLVGLFIMPLSLANELMGYWAFGEPLCQLWLCTDVLLCTASILNLAVISLDRYWSITRAVTYPRQRTLGRVMMMIAGVWILSMVVSLPPLVGWKRPQPVVGGFPLCVLSEEPGYVIYSTIGSFYVPLVVIVVVYSKIYLAARTRARRNLAAAAQKSRRSQRRMMQSVSQSTMASNLSNQLPRTDQSVLTHKEDTANQRRSADAQISTGDTAVSSLTPTTTDPERTWSEATASPSEAGEVIQEHDFDVEALSNAELDSDDETSLRGPHIIISPGLTVSDTASRQKSLQTGVDFISAEHTEPSASTGGLQVTSAAQTAAQVTAERERARRRLARSRERRATVVLGIVMASFIGCWLPFFFIYPLSLLLGFEVPALVFAVIFWLGYCNSALNPIIYTIFNREFRAAFHRMLCPGRLKAAANPQSRF